MIVFEKLLKEGLKIALASVFRLDNLDKACWQNWLQLRKYCAS